MFSFSFRLALYVYEYLLHVGAQKSAQTFLSEVSILEVSFRKYYILNIRLVHNLEILSQIDLPLVI